MVDALTPLLPKTWKFKTTEKSVPNIDTTWVLIHLQSVEKWAEAPKTMHENTLVVTVKVPGTDFDKSEDHLGDELDKFLFAIDTLNRPPSPLAIWWSKADKVEHEGNLAYEIQMTLITQQDKQPEVSP